ncbi:hypothetical protein Agub_g13990, partial [Astrephomene gubernaculifera]
MASSQGQQKTSQSPFSLFRPASWSKGINKAKQAKLGEENNMYFHPELKRWVERGKEEEAEREAAGPGPPPVVSGGSFNAAPLHKRSLSQRYVLQPNLSVSSMASLAGSLSQTDLANLTGPGDLSGPPSGLVSTAPSPPQSCSGMPPIGSGPPSGSGMAGAPPASSFFVPAPPQRHASQPLAGFFVPPPATPEDRQAEEEGAVAGTTMEEADGESGEAAHGATAFTTCIDDDVSGAPDGASQQQQQQAAAATSDAREDGESCASGWSPLPEVCEASFCAVRPQGDVSFGGAVAQPPPRAEAAADAVTDEVPLDLSPTAITVDHNKVEDCAAANGNGAGEESLSFDAALGHHSQQHQHHVLADSSQALACSPVSSPAGHSKQQEWPMLGREVRRIESSATTASDGGAVMSLHEGMGVGPVQQHQQHQPQLEEGAEAVAAEATTPTVT